MTLTRRVYAVLLAVTLMGFDCIASNQNLLPPVSEISYNWIDPINVKVSWTWERPGNLPPGCEVHYKFYPGNKEVSSKAVITANRYYSNNYLTGETGSGQWEVKVEVLGIQSCDGWKSINKSRIVTTKKPKGQLVNDFKCVADPSGRNCSWIPLNPDLNMAMSYRFCESIEKNIKCLKRCHHVYSDGMRIGCYLKVPLDEDICVIMETDSELKTFKPALVIPLPKMSIREDGERLNLSWTTPEVGVTCGWNYQVCYKDCKENKHCRTIQTPDKPTNEGLLHYVIGYNNECRYDFEFNVKSSHYCPDIRSDGSGSMNYGRNRDPVQPLKSTIVIASIFSITVSICLVLACYCFKRYQAILCPTMPDPSVLVKEMMVNGNKDFKTTTSILHTPMPEEIEPCKLTLVTENSILQENS